jgi:two-component system phosphate regulon response regulator OmpR
MEALKAMHDHQARILVVDDSAPYLDFMRILLSSEGFDVVTATSLGQVDGCLTTGAIDLVITDALLPGLAPFAVLDRLK